MNFLGFTLKWFHYIFKDAYKDLGYDINIIFSDPKNSPQLLDEKGKPKTGTAYVRDENGKKIKTIIINGEDPKNATKAGLIGTIVEEGSHVIGKVEGRQRKTGTDEKGLESTGRASNEYFTEKYKDDNTPISIHSDGKDYSNVDFGENVGNNALVIVGGIAILYIAGAYVVQQNGKTIGSYPDLKTAQKNAQYLLDKAGDGLKWIWNGGVWLVEQGGRIFAKRARQVQPGEVLKDLPVGDKVKKKRKGGKLKEGEFREGTHEGRSGYEGADGSWWEEDTAGHAKSRWKRWPKKPNSNEYKKEGGVRRSIGENGKVIGK